MIVAAAPNEGGGEVGFPANVNGLVVVEALTPLGTASQPQSVTPQLGIVAPGTDLIGLDGSEADVWPVSAETIAGTSYATPMVAAAIALEMSAWPQATPHQVLQALANTARPLDGSPAGTGTKSDEWGFGAIDLPTLIATDPTKYPDQNPFIRADGMPTPEDLAVVSAPSQAPSATPSASETAQSAVEEPTAAPTKAPHQSSGSPALGYILGGIAVVTVLAVVVLLARRSRKKTESQQEATP